MIPNFGYPTRIGNKILMVGTQAGPDYYFTGGSEISVQGLGVGAFDYVAFGVSQSGNYRAEARFEQSGAQQIVNMVVTQVSDGAEVAYGVDLGAEVFPALMICV